MPLCDQPAQSSSVMSNDLNFGNVTGPPVSDIRSSWANVGSWWLELAAIDCWEKQLTWFLASFTAPVLSFSAKKDPSSQFFHFGSCKGALAEIQGLPVLFRSVFLSSFETLPSAAKCKRAGIIGDTDKVQNLPFLSLSDVKATRSRPKGWMCGILWETEFFLGNASLSKDCQSVVLWHHSSYAFVSYLSACLGCLNHLRFPFCFTVYKLLFWPRAFHFDEDRKCNALIISLLEWVLKREKIHRW